MEHKIHIVRLATLPVMQRSWASPSRVSNQRGPTVLALYETQKAARLQLLSAPSSPFETDNYPTESSLVLATLVLASHDEPHSSLQKSCPKIRLMIVCVNFHHNKLLQIIVSMASIMSMVNRLSWCVWRTWAPKDPLNKRILHAGSKALYMEISRNHLVLVGSSVSLRFQAP